MQVSEGGGKRIGRLKVHETGCTYEPTENSLVKQCDKPEFGKAKIAWNGLYL